MQTPSSATASSRRDFLKGSGLALAATCLTSAAAAPRARGQSPSPLPIPPGGLHPLPNPATLHVRKDVATLAATDPLLVAYKKAVTQMQALPASDPRNWTQQAKIHNDHCPHRNWFFLPWHRAYLHYFEAICRDLSGMPNFALPYWNWTRDPQVPAPFWGNGNPLNHPRECTPNDTISPEFVGQTVITQILDLKDFLLFGSGKATTQRGSGGTGQLEGTPHNNVHVFIGDDMATFMSPRDPIFWLHHANVDRLWVQWNAEGNADTNDPVWTGFVFKQNFFNTAKQPVDIGVSQLTSTLPLGYRYDDQQATPPVVKFGPKAFMDIKDLAATAANEQSTETGTPLAVQMRASAQFLQSASSIAQKAAAAPLLAAAPPERVVRLSIAEITPPKNRRSYVRVFINCPYLTAATPINDPHYVGAFSFFGDDHGDAAGHEGHDGKGVAFNFDLTRTLGRLERSKRFPKEDIEVQLLALPLSGSGLDQRVELLPAKFHVTVATSEGNHP